jgi:hypothetical protein
VATIKSYTDLEQSKKLAEILPIESADMHYVLVDSEKNLYSPSLGKYIGILPHYPAWSLAALLSVLPFPQLSKDKLGSGKVGWMVSVYPNNCRYDSCWHDNPVDACVDMIEKLHELKKL